MLEMLNDGGTVAVCGAISEYDTRWETHREIDLKIVNCNCWNKIEKQNGRNVSSFIVGTDCQKLWNRVPSLFEAPSKPIQISA